MKLIIFALAIALYANVSEAKNVEVKITGMHCAPCAESITKALKEMKNVNPDSVVVNREKKLANLEITGEEAATEVEIKKVISSLGYKVKKIKNIDDKKIKNSEKNKA